MVRVTDGNTRLGSIGLSYRSPSASHQVAWNTTSTYFWVTSTDGSIVPFQLNPSAMTASRIPGAGDGGLVLDFDNEPEFSATNANVIYGISNGSNNRTVTQYDFAANAYSTVLNLDAVVPGLSGYVGGQAVGGVSTDNMMVFFGGPSQDYHHYALWFPVNNLPGRKMLDTTASTLDGVPTNVMLNFRLHSASIDKSGRYVILYPTGADLGSPRYASQVYIWDTSTGVFTAMTAGGHDGGPDVHPGGHDAPGFGYSVNHDCCTSSSWDAGQWQFRSLAAPLAPRDLISPVMTPKEIYLSEHPSWNNAQPDVLVPIISGTFRYGDNTDPWRAWDDEILAIETDAPSATVWRFAHHRSNIGTDGNPTLSNFWYEPRPNVSPNGRWVIFTSNWEKTLGSDPRAGGYRQDAFLLQLR